MFVRFFNHSHSLLVVVSLFICCAATAHEDHDPMLLGGIFPHISPDGSSIVLSHQGAIWRVPRGGGVTRRLTTEQGFDVRPTWSPDGSQVAYIRGRTAFAGPVRVLRAADGRCGTCPS